MQSTQNGSEENTILAVTCAGAQLISTYPSSIVACILAKEDALLNLQLHPDMTSLGKLFLFHMTD